MNINKLHIVAGATLAGLLTAATVASASTGPSVVLSSTASSTTSSSSIPITATFSEPVNGFSSSSIQVTNATVGSFSGSGANYTFNLMPTAAGTTTVVIPANSATSASSTLGNQESNMLTFLYQSATSTATTTPTISNINVSNIGTSSATVSWMTDIAATGGINYGTSTSYGATANESASASTSHSVMLNNLSEATLYHFQVKAGTATSSDQTFVTQSTASTTPLAIDSVTSNQSSGVADNLYADGWQWTIHFTVPDNENAFRIRFSDWGNASSSFATAGNVQIYSPESNNASSTSSAIGENGNGYSNWIYLNGDTATSTPGRQVDLVVQVKIPFGTAAGSYSSNFTAQTYPSSATSTATSTP